MQRTEIGSLINYIPQTKHDYDNMAEWELGSLVYIHGLPVAGTLEQKREFAMRAFIWPHQSFV